MGFKGLKVEVFRGLLGLQGMNGLKAGSSRVSGFKGLGACGLRFRVQGLRFKG